MVHSDSRQPPGNSIWLNSAPTSGEYLHIAKMTGLISSLVLAMYLAYRTVNFAPDVFMIGFLGILFAVFLTSLSRLLGGFTGYAYRWNLGIISLLLFASLTSFTIFSGAAIVDQVQKGARQFEAGAAELIATADEYPPLRTVVDSVPLLKGLRADSPPSQDRSDGRIDEPRQSDMGNGRGEETAGRSSSERGSQHGQEEPDDGQDGIQRDRDATEMAVTVTREVGVLAGRFFVTTFGLLTNLVLIVIVGLYLAASPQAYQRAPGYLFPPRVRPDVHRILTMTGETLWRWLLGRLFSMSLSGGGTAVFLYFCNVPSALLIGALTFLLGFIPNLGPLLAMGIATVFVLPQGLTTVAVVIGVLTFFELLESYLVAPLVTEHQVRLPPALVIFFQALMGICLGFIGLTVAAPLLAVVRILFNELYRKKLLLDSEVDGFDEDVAMSAPA